MTAPRVFRIVLADAQQIFRDDKDIARRFSLSEDTVKHHVSHVFDKLGVFSRLELAVFAINHKLVKDVEVA